MDPSSDQSVCTEYRTSPGQDLTQPTNKEHSTEQPAGSSSGRQDGGGAVGKTEGKGRAAQTGAHQIQAG